MLKTLFFLVLISQTGNGPAPAAGLPVPGISALPDSVSAIVTPEPLAPFLKSMDIYDRIHAAIRLGQIGGDKSLEMLQATYSREKAPPSLKNAYPNAKYYILSAIGMVGDNNAERFLFPIAQEYSASLLADSGRIPTPEGSDSNWILLGSFNGLAKVAGPSTTAFFDSICGLRFGAQWVRERACDSYYQTFLKSGAFRSAADSMNYLLANFRRLSAADMWDSTGHYSSQRIRVWGIKSALFRLSEKEADYIDRFLQTIPADDPAYEGLARINRELRKGRGPYDLVN
jgi:hypothetical protein